VGGTGSNRFVRVLPTNGLAGTVNLTITVVDSDGGQRSRPLSVRVDAFAETTATLPTLTGAVASWADFDNDGDLDIFLTASLKAALYRNDGERFTEKILNLRAQGFESATWGDIDRDGYLDFLYDGEGQSQVLRGLNDGTFFDLQLLLPGHLQSGPFAAALVDYDNDGDLDVYLGSALFRNDGSGGLSEVATALQGSVGRRVAWDDFDNDGDLDLAEYSYRFSTTRVWRNDGNGKFIDIGLSFPSGARPLAWGDYDNDGNVDLLLGIENGDRARLFRNRGDGTFFEVTAGLPSGGRDTVAWCDYDNDGYLDMLLAGTSASPAPARIYHNNRDGTFSDSEIPLPAVAQGDSVWGDYDNDNRVDLLLGSQVHLMRNFIGAQSAAPSAPTNLNTQVSSGGAVTMRWLLPDAALAAAMSFHHYNLRVGTTPGGSEVMSAASDPRTGRRRLANFGNAGTTNFWRLYLAPGTYYWSVQAIGPNLAASAFAEEATFAIVAPVITYSAVVANREFRCRFSGAAGVTYSVFGSSDLSTWTNLGTAQEVAPGVFEFADIPAAIDSRFYQVRSP
jgi:hypothetical protein